MASRALAAVARHADDYASVYATVLRQVQAAGHPALAWTHVRPRAGRLLGRRLDCRSDGELPQHHPRAQRKNRRHQNFSARRRPGNLHAPGLPPGVRMYTGDDFNYDRLILGDEQGHSDALAGHLRCHRSCRVAGAGRARCRRSSALPPTARAHRTALPTHLRVTDPALQNRRCFPGVSEWISIALPHGSAAWRAPDQSAHLCELFVLADQAGVLRDPELAAQRMRSYLLLAGVA